MSPELIAILAVGVALGGAMLATMRGLSSGMSDLRSEMREVCSDVGDLRERMARLEGLFESFIGRGRAGQESPAV